MLYKLTSVYNGKWWKCTWTCKIKQAASKIEYHTLFRDVCISFSAIKGLSSMRERDRQTETDRGRGGKPEREEENILAFITVNPVVPTFWFHCSHQIHYRDIGVLAMLFFFSPWGTATSFDNWNFFFFQQNLATSNLLKLFQNCVLILASNISL